MVRYPENDFTRNIEDTAATNRGLRGGVASATPSPTVRSADLGSFTELPPLTEEERAELDAKMAALSGGPASDSPLTAAGAEEPPTRMTAREFLAQRALAGAGAGLPGAAMYRPARLPNFTAVEGIDLVRNVVTIDGMAFAISEHDAADFKRYAVDRAKAAIMESLDQAENLFSTPMGVTDGENEVPEVQREPEGGSEEPAV